MKAIAGELPGGERAADWSYEIKWDGMRLVAEASGTGVTVRSTRGTDSSASFPELDALAEAVGDHEAVLDGEVVAFDPSGRPSFGALQGRMHVADRAEAVRRSVENPVVFMVFDLLWLDGDEVWRQPYTERRQRLDDLVTTSPTIQVPAAFDDGELLLQATRDQGLEGIVAKRLDSAYEPGKRSPKWRKVKVRNEQEFVVAGWLGGAGNRSGAIGSLVLGCHEDGVLRWVGNVGTGFSARELDRLGKLIDRLEVDSCPFDVRPIAPTGTKARWVRPELVVQVAFGEWTGDGRLRHPAYLGERTDKVAADVTCDP